MSHEKRNRLKWIGPNNVFNVSLTSNVTIGLFLESGYFYVVFFQNFLIFKLYTIGSFFFL